MLVAVTNSVSRTTIIQSKDFCHVIKSNIKKHEHKTNRLTVDKLVKVQLDIHKIYNSEVAGLWTRLRWVKPKTMGPVIPLQLNSINGENESMGPYQLAIGLYLHLTTNLNETCKIRLKKD